MAVIGAQGISRKTGLSEVNPEIAELNRLLSEHSEKTWVLADLSKAGVKSPFHTLDLDQVDTIVTTHDGVDLFEFEVAGACHVISAPLSPFSFQGNP
jgi:DeoR/GlpR family transcriptional regulator of sugar metabolism